MPRTKEIGTPMSPAEAEWLREAHKANLEVIRLRAALQEILACDYRGNMPPEQVIARAALEYRP